MNNQHLAPNSRKSGALKDAWPCALLAILTGLLLIATAIGAGLQRWAFDLLFLTRSARPTPEVAIVYMDEPSFLELAQVRTAPWSRALHGQFLRRMKEAGAKAVVFDIVFSDTGDPLEDGELAAGIKEMGVVFMGADLVETPASNGVPLRTLSKPIQTFLSAGAEWGNVSLIIDPDYAIRRQFPPDKENLTLVMTALKGITGRLPPETSFDDYWINYYGPPGYIPSRSYYQALTDAAVRSGFFKDKVVFVGQNLPTDVQSKLKDELATPYTWRRAGAFSPGVEIQATAFLNILRHEQLRRIPLWVEIFILMAFGGGLGLWVPRLPLTRSLVASGVSLLIIVSVAAVLFNAGRWWWAWTIPVIQVLIVAAYTITSQSLRNFKEKQRLTSTLELHLSPSRVRQLMNDPELLKPGGHEAEVSVVFSDIAGFSTLSETMVAKDIFDALNRYYECALASVFKEEGMVVSLIGDAIMAIWNAPDTQADHQKRACLAALDLHHRLVEFDRQHATRPMHTRVGVHTGTAVVGNLGSKNRFQFTAIGETVNLASRLEGLNKYLGTSVLASRQAQRSVEGFLTTRYAGDFVLKGFVRAVEVHELIGGPEMEQPTRAWREAFAEGLRHYQRGRIAAAKEKFQQTIELRRQADSSKDGSELRDDGLSTFYLNEIKENENQQLPSNWRGLVELADK